jgi:tetratricopeptide (TPR) repeat protein
LQTASRSRSKGALLVALAAFAVHARTVTFGLVDLDDRDLIVDDHPFLVRAGGLWRAFGRSYLGVVDVGHAYYRPVVTASYALDARWSGIDPRGYHLTNVLLGCAVAALLHDLLRTLRLGAAVALAGGLAFALHPVLVPVVAWIPGRNDGLVAVFSLAAWLAFARALERPAWRWKAAHLALFALALFSKETAFVLPLVCLVHSATTSLSDARREGLLAVPLGLWVGWAAILVVRLLAHPLTAGASPAEVLGHLPLLVSALGKAALPYDPTAMAVAADLPMWPGVVAGLALATATWSVPGVRKPVVGLGLAAFVAFLLPVIALGGSLVLDSRLLLPTCGVVLAAGEVVRAAAVDGRTLAAGAAALGIGLAAISAGAEGTFANARAFALAAVAVSPHCPLAHVCLGRSYQAAGDDDRALEEYAAALALGPAEIVHNNVAVLYMKRARWEDAQRELAAELALNPRYGRAYLNLAIVLRREGRTAEACAAATRAADLSPEFAGVATELEVQRDCAEGASP